MGKYDDCSVSWRGENYVVTERDDGVKLENIKGTGADWLVTGYLFEHALASGVLAIPDRRDE